MAIYKEDDSVLTSVKTPSIELDKEQDKGFEHSTIGDIGQQMPELIPTISVSEKDYRMITSYAATQEDPQKAMYDASAAILFSRNTGLSADYCLENLETLSQTQIGQPYKPTQTWWKSITNSYKIGDLTLDRGKIGKAYAEARHNGEDYSGLEAQMQQLDAEIESLQDYAPRSWATKALKAAAQSLPYTMTIAASRGIAGGVAKVATKFIPGIADDIAVKFVEIASSVAGVAKTNEIMWGSMYYDMVNKGIDEDVAWYMSKASGIASGLIEDGLGRLLGGVTRTATQALGITGGSVLNNLVSRMYANGSLGNVGMLLTRIVSTGFGEGSEEFVESIKDKVFENLAYTLSDMEVPVEQSFRTAEGLRNNFSDAAEDFIWGALSGIIMGVVPDVINVRRDARAATVMKEYAKVSPNYETFSKVMDTASQRMNLRSDTFSDNEMWENAKKKVFNSKEATEARKTAFSKVETMGDIEESETYDSEGNATKNPRFYNDEGEFDETRGGSSPVSVKKMSNGRYFSQESENTTAEGYSIMKFGSPDATDKVSGKFPLYGQIEYSMDDNTLRIEGVRFKNGVSEEDITNMVRQFLRENPDMDIEWEADTKLEESVKSTIEKENNGTLVQTDAQSKSDHEAIVKTLDSWMGDLGEEDPFSARIRQDEQSADVAQTSEDGSETTFVEGADNSEAEVKVPRDEVSRKSYDSALKNSLATVIQMLGEAEGKSGQQWLKSYIKEIRRGTDQELGNTEALKKKGKSHKGLTKLELDETTNEMRAVIYYGKTADASTFLHELNHVVMMQSNHRAEFSEIFNRYRNDSQFREFVQKNWATFKGSFGSVENVDSLMSSLFKGDDWGRDEYEFVASLYEAYLVQRSAFQNKPLAAFFDKITSWMRRVYNSIRGRADLNDEIASFFDRVYGADGKVSEGQSLTFSESDALMYTSAEEDVQSVLDQFNDTEAMLLREPGNFDKEGNHLAPNGQKSNLTYKQWVLVRTPNFKRWFGDWENDPQNASKVVDANGEPLVVYHGSSNYGFNVFDPRESDSQFGDYKFGDDFAAYFATDFTSARSFTKNWSEAEVYSVFLNIRNPYVVSNTTESDSKNSFNIKDETLRDYQLSRLDEVRDKWEYRKFRKSSLDEINEDFRTFRLRIDLTEDGDFRVVRMGNNSMFGSEMSVSYGSNMELDDDNWEDIREDIVSEDPNDYYFTTDDVVNIVLSMNRDDGYKYDGVLIADIFDSSSFGDRNSDYVTIDSPNQIKSATDNNGEYSTYDNNILHQTVTDEDEIREIEKDGTIKLVRMMQIIDGKIYSPINATWYDDNGNAHMSDPFELDVWYKSEEHPELAKPDGDSYKFLMHKTPNDKDANNNKLTPVEAAYNPYMHGSKLWLNDQFKSVIRPNLVYVEIEMPNSDLNSGYHAQYAKDPVGPLEWKSGTVTNVVNYYSKKPRIVYLSRYMKVNRVIPNSEVAPHIKEELNGLPMAYESVTPGLREELEKIGVDIVPLQDYTAIYGKKKKPGIEKISRWGKPYPNETLYQSEDLEGENFKRWFGDWQNNPQNASKIVNEDGTPKVVYHGSMHFFDIFEKRDLGFHFGNKAQAQEAQYNHYNTEAPWFGTAEVEEGEAPDLYDVYLSIRNPIRINEDFGDWTAKNIYLVDYLHDNHYITDEQFNEIRPQAEIDFDRKYSEGTELTDKLRGFLQANGYDGIVYLNQFEGIDYSNGAKNPGYSDSYIAFEPNQIKSASRNSGEYDPNNPSILYQIADSSQKTEADYGLYVNNDSKEHFADLILEGLKTIETRTQLAFSNLQRAGIGIGDEIGIVYRGQLHGYARIADFIMYDSEEAFRADYDKHLVPEGSQWDYDENKGKVGIVLENPRRIEPIDVIQDRGSRTITTLYQTVTEDEYQDGINSGDIRINADGSVSYGGKWVDLVRSLDSGLRGTLNRKTNTVDVRPSFAKRVRAALTGQHRVTGNNVSTRYLKDSSGKIIGAPARYNTTSRLRSLRKVLTQLTNEGAYGRFWYEESSRAILEAVGGDIEEAKRFAAVLAILSPQMKVDANTTIALKAWAQYKAGEPIDVKTENQNTALNDLLYKNIEWSGQKTNNFYVNLLRIIDPSTEDAQGVTVDMWMMRAFGYKNDSPTDAQYQFVEKVTSDIAKNLGWENQQVQAAIWVALKKRTEDADVKRETEAKSEKLGYMTYKTVVKDGKEKKVRQILDEEKHRGVWLKTAMDKAIEEISQESHEGAGFNFKTGLERNIGQISSEVRPSIDKKTGLPRILPGYDTASPELKAQYLRDVWNIITEGGAIDGIAKEFGLLQLGNMEGASFFENNVGLGVQSLFSFATSSYSEVYDSDGKFIGYESDSSGKVKRITDEQRKVLRGYCATIGAFLRQDSVAYNKMIQAKNLGESSGSYIRVGRTLTQRETVLLAEAIVEAVKNNGFSATADDFALIAHPLGMMVVNFSEGIDNKSYQKMFETATTRKAKDGTEKPLKFDPTKRIMDIWANKLTNEFGQDYNLEYEVVGYKHDSELIGNDWEAHPNGEGYLQGLGERGQRAVYERCYSRFGSLLQRLNERYSEEYGWGDPGQIPSFNQSYSESLNQSIDTSEISDEVASQNIESYFSDGNDGIAGVSTVFDDLVVNEMRHAIDYPQRNYNTVATDSLLYKLRAEARTSADVVDFIAKANEELATEDEPFALEDLTTIWEDVQNVSIEEGQKTSGTLEEPNADITDPSEKVAQFIDILSDKENFTQFLNALRKADLSNASLFINNLVSRLSNEEQTGNLTSEGFRIAYGQVLENADLYMDLYGQATDNDYWKTSTEIFGDIEEELSSEFNEVTSQQISEIANSISDSDARNALLNGTETNENGAIEKAQEKNRKTIEDLLEEKRKLDERLRSMKATGKDVYDARTEERMKAGKRISDLKAENAEISENAADLQRTADKQYRMLLEAQRNLEAKSDAFKADALKDLHLTEEELAKEFPTLAKALNGEYSFETEEDFREALRDKNYLSNQTNELLRKYRQLLTAKKNQEVAQKVYDARTNERFKSAVLQKRIRDRYAKVNQDLKDAYREREALKKAKRLKMSLARKIMRKVSNNVNWRQAREIREIQAEINPTFAKRMKVGERFMSIDDLRDIYRENADDPIFETMSVERMHRILGINLNDMTIDDLRSVALLVDELRAKGLKERQAYVDAQANAVKAWRDRFIDELLKTGKVSNTPPQKGSQEEAVAENSVKNKLKNIRGSLLNMSRKAQIMDNNTKGYFYDLLLRQKREHEANEYRNIKKRVDPIEALMKEKKVDYSDFYTNHTITIDGWGTQTFTFSSLLYFYLSQNNEKNRQAVAYGNFVTDAEKSGPNGIKARADSMVFEKKADKSAWMNQEVKRLGDPRYRQVIEQAKRIIDSKPELKPIIEAIENDFNSDSFERVREVMLKVFNQEVGREDYYLPLRRNSLKGKSAEEQMREDILKTVPGTRSSKSVRKGMTEDRIEISPINQSSVEADFMKVWADSVTDQEHLVEFLEYSKTLNTIFGNSGSSAVLKSYITQAHGTGMMKDVQTHLQEIANPNIGKDAAASDDIIRYLRGGLYSAYLGFKTSSIVNQAITSPAAFLGKVNIVQLMKGYLTMTAHPKEMWNTICELSPMMATRSIDPTRQMIMDERENAKRKGKTGNKVKDTLQTVRNASGFVFGEVGLKGLDWIDRFSVAGGWWAIYQSELAKMDGGDLETNQRNAAKIADEYVLETQPLSNKTEVAPLFKDRNQAVQLLTQFQASLNVVWSNITYDIPRALGWFNGKEGMKESLKSGEYKTALGMIVGYAISGALLLLVTDGFDDDDDDKKKMKKIAYSLFNQPIAGIPLVSNMVDNALKRIVTGEKTYNYSNSLYPAFEKAINIPVNVIEKNWEKALSNTWQTIALSNGLPYSGIKEIMAIKDNGLGALLGRRNK